MNILLTTSAAPGQTPFSTTEKRAPIGMGYLIAVLRDAGHHVFFIDNYLKPSNFLETNYLQEKKIDIVGIYTNTICFRDTLRMLYCIEEMRSTKQWKGKIVAGGPHASVSPEDIPDFVDHIVIGEGEYALRDIAAGKINERIVNYPPIKNLDDLPMPAWDYFMKLPYDWGGNWLPQGPVITMNTSRGCPFNCGFCSVRSIWGKRYTYFSAERIVSDIEHLILHHGAKGIYFREDNFTLCKPRLRKFCNLIIEKGLKIPWVCESRASSLNREVVELMARAGAKGVYIGVESGSQRLLDFMQKGINIEDIRRAFSLCKENGINTAASIIVGVPTETEQDIQKTAALLEEIKPTVTWYNIFVGIPKSKLYHYVLENKLYEYIDDRGLVYLKGHNNRVQRWYGKAWDASLPVKIENHRIENPKVSILMSVFNGEKYLNNAILSIQRQTFNNFEFIIINDGSTDKTKTILRNLNDPRIRIIHNKRNLGLTKSLNIAIKHARGKYLARMDADDVSHPLRIEKQVSYLDRHPNTAMVGCAFYAINENGLHNSYINVLTDSGQIKAGLEKQNWFCHGSVMLQKSVIEKIGLYNEKFKYAQDYDLWLRISEQFEVANINEALYFWRKTKEGISEKKSFEQQKYAQMAKQYAKDRKIENVATTSVIGRICSPMVSVVVPTFNRPKMLEETIKSIISQRFKDFEIIVINDGGQSVEEMLSTYSQAGNIYYVRHALNSGLSATRNSGLRLARGKYIAYLDDDDLFYPDHLETLVDFLENSNFKIAYTDAYRAHQVKQNGKYVTTHKDLPLSLDFDYNKILYENFVPVLCFMHEKQCLDVAGNFDESLCRHEDWDLWIRLSRHYKMAHLKKVTCEFSSRKDGSSMTSGKKAGFRTTCERIYQKYAEYSEGKPIILKAQSRMRSILRGAEALQLMKEGNVHQAIRLMEDCLSFDPNFPDNHKILGTLYSSLEKNGTALKYYEKAAQLCVSDADYQKNQKVMREHIGSELSANPTLDRHKKKIAALMQKGENLVKLGRLKEASDTFQAIFEFDPFHLDGINSLGEIAMKAGLAESALFFFQRALEIDTSNKRSLLNMSVCLRNMGRTDAAKELFKRNTDHDLKGSDQYPCAISNF